MGVDRRGDGGARQGGARDEVDSVMASAHRRREEDGEGADDRERAHRGGHPSPRHGDDDPDERRVQRRERVPEVGVGMEVPPVKGCAGEAHRGGVPDREAGPGHRHQHPAEQGSEQGEHERPAESQNERVVRDAEPPPRPFVEREFCDQEGDEDAEERAPRVHRARDRSDARRRDPGQPCRELRAEERLIGPDHPGVLRRDPEPLGDAVAMERGHALVHEERSECGGAPPERGERTRRPRADRQDRQRQEEQERRHQGGPQRVARRDGAVGGAAKSREHDQPGDDELLLEIQSQAKGGSRHCPNDTARSREDDDRGTSRRT